jgi:hypothetical protein
VAPALSFCGNMRHYFGLIFEKVEMRDLGRLMTERAATDSRVIALCLILIQAQNAMLPEEEAWRSAQSRNQYKGSELRRNR